MEKGREVSKLYERAGLWETRSKQAALKGDYNRAGRLRTKALQLAAKARRLEEKDVYSVNKERAFT
ncbi:hypothetical protein J6TS7_57840 [Paenibacillus dendritiformis]|uniref:hypothetical protein n=1 Tax=Paenibacillus TaxID=44249 RepID=UPI001B0DB082|nr:MULTISPECIES: hypothetical protein [Paenibacillus]MEB9897191.1 hypothetical protein [Bacillus cereus]GIO82174.1 hypothetical protein J6TS7_57840 [Paenibacillus dendritiformis]CAH8721261.1 hypothetical protein HTL2_006270 [Paenibacillus melissococcoides]